MNLFGGSQNVKEIFSKINRLILNQKLNYPFGHQNAKYPVI